MTDATDDPRLRGLLAGLAAGDPDSRDELVEYAASHLEGLVRSRMEGFPRVRRWEQTADVAQEMAIRLTRALAGGRPTTPRAFLGLCARQVRFHLLDAVARLYGPEGFAGHHHTNVPARADNSAAAPLAELKADDATPVPAAAERAEMIALLATKVDGLSPALREVIDLRYYGDLDYETIAGLTGVSSRTIRNRERDALRQLHTGLSRP